jgi:predicted nucleotidyltransferase
MAIDTMLAEVDTATITESRLTTEEAALPLAMGLRASSNPTVQRALRLTRRLPQVCEWDGIILFGSFARCEEKPNSDVDILVVGAANLGSIIHHQSDISLDVTIYSHRSLLERINKENEWNDNFWVKALHSAFVLADEAGAANLVMDRAAARWREGPPAMSAEAMKRATRAIQTMYFSSKAHRHEFCSLSAERRRLRVMRLDQVVTRIFFLDAKAHRRWTGAFPQMVADSQEDSPELYSLWCEYIGAQPETSHTVVERMVSWLVKMFEVQISSEKYRIDIDEKRAHQDSSDVDGQESTVHG